MDKFITSIKKKYRDRLINCEEQWPPCYSNKLVRLELVEREKGEGCSANQQRGRRGKYIKRTPLAYDDLFKVCLLYTSPSPRDATLSRMPSSA